MTAAEIARALAASLGGGVDKTGGQYFVRCPCHAERTGSLALRDAEVGVLVYCHGGCDRRDVIAEFIRLGLWPSRSDASSRIDQPVFRLHRDGIAERRALALRLWHRRRPIEATLAETYLREHRGITCPLPRTLGFLPARGLHPPALVAAFGIAHEIEPGVIAIDEHAVMAVHFTKLTADGRKHPDTPNKITLASPSGVPIVIAPTNDLLGLAICEGIEDALTIHEDTGLGAWAAGSAGMMPALANTVPDYADCVTIFEDSDEAGRRNAAQLAERLAIRGIHADIMPSAGAAP